MTCLEAVTFVGHQHCCPYSMAPIRSNDIEDSSKTVSCESEEDTYEQSSKWRMGAMKGRRDGTQKSRCASFMYLLAAIGAVQTWPLTHLFCLEARRTPYLRLKSCGGTSISSATFAPEAEKVETRDNDASNASRALIPLHEPITVCGIELRPTVAFDTFWRVAAERKAMDDRRRAGLPAP